MGSVVVKIDIREVLVVNMESGSVLEAGVEDRYVLVSEVTGVTSNVVINGPLVDMGGVVVVFAVVVSMGILTEDRALLVVVSRIPDVRRVAFVLVVVVLCVE